MNTRVPRTQNPRAQRRDDIRLALLNAIEELAEEGFTFSDITVERMAARAGISRAKFYVYFEDKADVLRAWFDEVTVALRQETAHWWAMAAGSSREDLRTALRAASAAYRPHVTLMAAVIDTAMYDPDIRAAHAAFLDDHIDDMVRHIRVGQAGDFITPDLLPEETAWWLALMGERMQHVVPADTSADGLERHLDAYVEIVWRTLYA